jgi:transposase InsO family protein
MGKTFRVGSRIGGEAHRADRRRAVEVRTPKHRGAPKKTVARETLDITYLRIAGAFFYLCAVLDGTSRFIVHWELRAQTLEQDVELTIQRAKERFPEARPRIISDNGPQFIAKDFKEFIRRSQMTHLRTSPYPHSNGKLERWNHSFESEGFRPGVPLTLEDGLRVAARYIEYTRQSRSGTSPCLSETRQELPQRRADEARAAQIEVVPVVPIEDFVPHFCGASTRIAKNGRRIQGDNPGKQSRHTVNGRADRH